MWEALRWMRDWALLGGITCAIVPGVAVWFGLIPHAFPWAAAVLGAASGAVVGLAMCATGALLPERARVALAALWVPVLGGWGAAVSVATADLAGMSLAWPMACGSIAALLQALWCAPAYALLARRGDWRWPLLAGAAPMALLVGVAVAKGGERAAEVILCGR
jgi:hypothetical protein